MKIDVVFLIIASVGFPACSLPKARGRHRDCALARQGKLPVFGRKSGVSIVNHKRKRRPNPLLELPNTKVGPKRNPKYDPTFGYEPYWEGGDWVFDSLEAEEDDMCGTRCNQIYVEYGRICGRNKRFEHKTFNHYCEMRNHDCSGKDGWSIAYRGNCTTIRTFPTHEGLIATRVSSFLYNYSERIYG